MILYRDLFLLTGVTRHSPLLKSSLSLVESIDTHTYLPTFRITLPTLSRNFHVPGFPIPPPTAAGQTDCDDSHRTTTDLSAARHVLSSLAFAVTMVSDEHYEICLPILADPNLDDEDRTDKLEDLLRKETALRDAALEHAILDALWRFRDGGASPASPPTIRQTILRRPSPASWRGNSNTPLSGSPRLGVSPLAPPGFVPSNFSRNKSSAVSPFSSPRPSPRLAFATPVIPNSPNLNAYEFANDANPSQETFGDYQTENVEWLVADDAVSTTSSVGTSSGLNAAAPEFSSLTSQQNDMSPYDMLRSILGQSRTDEDIEAALATHNYDLSATIIALMESTGLDGSLGNTAEETKSIVIGKSMTTNGRPTTPAGPQRNGVICKFYMSTGQCLRSDCRFSHDLSNHLCK